MISLSVLGMSCGHCVKAVTQAVHEVDQDAAVSVSLENHRVDIESSATEARFRQAIEAAGYEVPAAGA